MTRSLSKQFTDHTGTPRVQNGTRMDDTGWTFHYMEQQVTRPFELSFLASESQWQTAPVDSTSHHLRLPTIRSHLHQLCLKILDPCSKQTCPANLIPAKIISNSVFSSFLERRNDWTRMESDKPIGFRASEDLLRIGLILHRLHLVFDGVDTTLRR